MQGYKYKLGTLIYDDNGTNLKPAGTFQFATQIDATDQTDTGRLLLFIPTTYNPGGGSQTALGLADIVPQGCSTALDRFQPGAVRQEIRRSFYETTISKFGVQATGQPDRGWLGLHAHPYRRRRRYRAPSVVHIRRFHEPLPRLGVLRARIAWGDR